MSENHIPEKVYDNLVNTINKNLHLLHRYVSLRKKVLGVDELHMWDFYTPLVKESNMEYTYEEAKRQWLKASLHLGEEYVSIVKKALKTVG